MTTSIRRRSAERRLHMLGMWLALAFAVQGCDKFFEIRGVLVDCETSQAIQGAEGLATAAGYVDLSVEYDGRPSDGDHLQLCMNRSP